MDQIDTVMEKSSTKNNKPLILAPAGNKASFMAAVAAGADAIYCGLKDFSARKEAKNFSVKELAPLVKFARDHGIKIYIAFNSLIKTDEINSAGGLVKQLEQFIKPDALIVQDLSLIQLIEQTGFSGGLHLSTIANVCFPAALKLIKNRTGIDRVVLPRELNIDEIKLMASACPKGIDLEVFIHGALCYAVSGRCYWSSYLGGKSGLRGQCVQPCRRNYSHNNISKRFFSCRDLGLDTLVKVLLQIPQIKAWKIEGRKKNPYYVYQTIKAYRMLRDHGSEPEAKKEALFLLDRSLGRERTHYNFLPQRPWNPVNTDSHTGSGLLMGYIKGSRKKPFIATAKALMPQDKLRIGYEDEPWHSKLGINKSVPSGGRYFLNIKYFKNSPPGTPVFLTDRREKSLEKKLSALENKIDEIPRLEITDLAFKVKYPKSLRKKASPFELKIYRNIPFNVKQHGIGIWLSEKALKDLGKNMAPRIWWWLPPVIWPKEEIIFQKRIRKVMEKGARNFVLNIPWQTSVFKSLKSLNLWAGPFCNITNPLAISTLKSMGFNGCIVSPELGQKDYLSLPPNSPLPLGIVISGNWPLCISRTISPHIKLNKPFISPKKEKAWVSKYDSDYWVYPDWKLDLNTRQDELKRAGYSMLVHLVEPLPEKMALKKRPGIWNWNINLY